MRILVDTHVLVWDFLAPSRISANARTAMNTARESDDVLIADISLWEIAMLIEKGRIEVNTDSEKFLNAIVQVNSACVLPISSKIAALSVKLPATVNKDPADRLIVATAMTEAVPLVTADRNLQAITGMTTIW